MRSRATRLASGIVAAGSLGALLVTAHTLVNLRRLRTPTPSPPAVGRRTSILIPARDEAGIIGRCLDGARSQRQVPHLEIIVLDDRSSDHTAQVVEHHLTDPRVRLRTGEGEPPASWLGKAWACQQLADAAKGEVLAFVDADVVLEPHALSACIELLQPGVDAVSPHPRQVADSVAERLVQPLLQWSWLSFLPLRRAELSARPSLTAANGQFLVITRDAYDAIGGHATVRGEVLEDLGIFRALKRVGRTAIIADGTSLATCRMYTDWSDLRDGYTKSLWAAFGSKPGAAGVGAALVAMYVVPPAAMLKGSRIGALGYAAAVVGRMAVGRRVQARLLPDALAHPASIALFTYLVGASWYRRDRGRLMWKGRQVAPGQPRATT